MVRNPRQQFLIKFPKATYVIFAAVLWFSFLTSGTGSTFKESEKVHKNSGTNKVVSVKRYSGVSNNSGGAGASKAPTKTSSGKKEKTGKEENNRSQAGSAAEEGLVLAATPAFVDMDLPTDNQMIFSKNGSDAFFQPTFSGRVVSAMFGCVRNLRSDGKGTRFHEGVDIRPQERKVNGEPVDEVKAAGAGQVAMICSNAGDSNYGKYLVLRHEVLEAPIYTLYAHLATVADDLKVDGAVERGQNLGVLGRTSNEFHIHTDRAHLHFEVNLMVNERYVQWCMKTSGSAPNHGLYNGTNLIGLDPVRFFQYLQSTPNPKLGNYILREKIAFRAVVPYKRDVSWLRMYPFALMKDKSGGGGEWHAYEISMNYYGLPILFERKTREQLSANVQKALAKGIYPMTYANAIELRSNPCPGLLINRGKLWGLGPKGHQWLRHIMY
jgi:peptidoglycan LD-endopeptidase LytH